ncbi:MAG TPA: hypothetical protein VGP31_19645 [Planosporangium sp.]|jgi:hypothetical protein|nr:hypothetical protein [Planosporangium sp.]
MTGNRRLYALVLSCVIAATALLSVGARAWATATVHRTEVRCSRPAAVATAASGPVVSRPERSAAQGPAATGQGLAPRSWRAHTLRAAGCGAWRQVHDRMQHRHHDSRRRA